LWEQELNEEENPIRMFHLFSLQDIKQIKWNLGKFSDDPDKLRASEK
jgi:hypothetical protein